MHVFIRCMCVHSVQSRKFAHLLKAHDMQTLQGLSFVVACLPLMLTSKVQQAQREAEKAERERQTQTVNMDAQLMLAKEVSVAGASILTAKDAAGCGSGIASMLAGLRGGESSDSSDSDDD